jgi:hypothetical protein
MIVLDLSILNQKGTPMFNSDTLANRPAAGIVGRIFIAIDSPFGIYRDTGSAWDQISGASTFSGSLATGQVAFGSATNTISGSNGLYWNNSTSSLSIGFTTNPATALEVYTPTGGDNILATFRTGNFGSNAGIQFMNSTNVNSQIVGLFGNNLAFRYGTTEGARLTGSGNFHIGPFVADAGQRLQVQGDTFLKGSGSTSATTAFQVQNSAGGLSFLVTNDRNTLVTGNLMFGPSYSVGSYGTISNVSQVINVQGINNGSAFKVSGGVIADFFPNNGNIIEFINNVSSTNSKSVNIFSTTGQIGNATATATSVNVFRIGNTIDQGAGTTTTIGVYVNPTLTSANDWRSIQWSNNTGWGIYGAGTALNYLGGTLGIKTTSPYSPSTFSLDVNGGLLVKNTAGTTAQITLINANPALGGNEGFLVTSVGGTSGTSYAELQGYYGLSITGSTALRLNPAGGSVIVNSTTNTGEQFQLTGTLRINGQQSATSGGNSGQHLIINLDGTQYKIKLELP